MATVVHAMSQTLDNIQLDDDNIDYIDEKFIQ